MAPRYWIKLYIEILDDPKMGIMPDWLWRRAIELFLAAGENGNDGLLPPVTQLAWRLRLPEPKLGEALRALSEVGVVHETPQGWVVTNFAKRQDAVPDAERKRYQRKVSRSRHEFVTKRDTDTESESDTDTDAEAEVEAESEAAAAATGAFAQVARAYEQEIGVLTANIAERLRGALEDYPAEWIIQAIREAALSNARSWRYCEAILRRWREEGFKSQRGRNGRERGARARDEQIERIAKNVR